MAITDQVKDFAPVSGWKQWVGLAIAVVLIVALALKFGVQRKVNGAIKAS